MKILPIVKKKNVFFLFFKQIRLFRLFCLLLGIVSFFFFYGIGCYKASSSKSSLIRIGEVTTLTGSESSFGMTAHRGVELAIKDVNDSGGIFGKKLELVTLDDQGRPEETTTAATKLLSSYKVVALTGALPSSRAIAIAPIVQKFKVPMVSSASTHPDVTRFGNYVFRVCFIDSFQGKVMAKFALEHLNIKKIALLKDSKSDYSSGLSQFFVETFKQGGGEIVIEQSYSSGDIDFKAQLTAIRAKSFEAIFIPGYYTDSALIARQARELGIQAPILGGDGWDSPQFLKIGQEAVNNGYYSTHYSPEDRSPIVQKFIENFKKHFGATPDGLAVLGYDAILVLADAMRRSKSLDPSDIRSALEKTSDFLGVSGKMKFDSLRNPIKSAVIMKIQEGKVGYMTTITP